LIFTFPSSDTSEKNTKIFLVFSDPQGILDLSKTTLEKRQQKKICNPQGVLWVGSRHFRQCSYQLTVSGYMVYFRRRLRAGNFKTGKRQRKTKKY